MEHSEIGPRAIAESYITAVGARQLEVVGPLLHDDLEARVGEKVFSKAEWLGALQRLIPVLARNDIRQTIVHDDEACVIYDFVTDTDAGAVPTAEVLTFATGRIRTIRLVFETARWPEVLAALERRAVTT